MAARGPDLHPRKPRGPDRYRKELRLSPPLGPEPMLPWEFAPQEQIVIQHLKVGKKQLQIAKLMGLSPKTIATYMANARKRKGAETSEQLMFWIGFGKC
jgi:DNA-binding NarL/FixJ family response regulator